MFKKFVADSRTVVVDAREVASELQSPTLEAEHLLLAVARCHTAPAQAALVEAGLEYDDARAVLDAELAASLAAVGVSIADFDLRSSRDATRTPRWGASAKLALERALKAAAARGQREVAPGHILLGVLEARTGTVPRALERAGIDRAELGRRVAATL